MSTTVLESRGSAARTDRIDGHEPVAWLVVNHENDTDLDQAAASFMGTRPRLVRLADRVLGNRTEAEDAVQEAWLRWQRTDRTVVINASAFLATTTTRLALNVAQSAHHRHETPVDSWIREPRDRGHGPEALVEQRDDVERAVRLLLERLTPAERAAYLLREVFDYPYDRISELLGLGVANARQVVTRARRHVSTDRHRPVSPETHRRLVRAFRSAAETGSLVDLERLLAADVVS